MQRKDKCYKYRKWKAEQAKKLKEAPKEEKPKRKEPVTDCVDEDEKQLPPIETVLKISYRKCKKKKKKKKKELPGQKIRHIIKHVSLGELILQCIKPAVEERHKLINHRHIDCFNTSVSKSNVPSATAETASSSKTACKRRLCSTGKKGAACREAKLVECENTCAFADKICLAGVKLTSKDKEEIKKFQREAQQSDKKE